MERKFINDPLKPWIGEKSFPLNKWVRLHETDVEVMWFERSGVRWLRYRKVKCD